MKKFSNSCPVLRRTVLFVLWVCFAGLLRCAEPAPVPEPAPAPRTILFFGDSLTAGLGLDNPDAESFPALVQKKITAARLPWRVVNAGLSGDTTAAGLRRVDWVLRQPADIFVLELGANDGLRGLPVAGARANLQAIIDKVRAKNPAAKIVLAGMKMPGSLGVAYVHDFAAMFPALAEKNRLTLIPFLLEGVATIPALNQADGLHPTAAGHIKVAETVWPVLKPLL